MNVNFNSEKPIFLQIADGLSDSILSGIYPEQSQIPSITEFATSYKINPATALKGVNMLVDKDIIYKKRGLGMFVQDGAVEKLKNQRKEKFYDNYISALVSEANRLGITKDEIKDMLERSFNDARD